MAETSVWCHEYGLPPWRQVRACVAHEGLGGDSDFLPGSSGAAGRRSEGGLARGKDMQPGWVDSIALGPGVHRALSVPPGICIRARNHG